MEAAAEPRPPLRTTMRYLADVHAAPEHRPYTYVTKSRRAPPGYEPPPGCGAKTQNHFPALDVLDGRAAPEPLSLARHGCALLPHATALRTAEFYANAPTVTEDYYGECAELVARATGATKVVPFDHVVVSHCAGCGGGWGCSACC